MSTAVTALRKYIDRVLADEQGERDRRLVMAAVTESLSDLGYQTTEIDLGTPDSLVLNSPGSPRHGVAIEIGDGELAIRPVRTSAEQTSADEDSAADHALCADLPSLLEGLAAKGVGSTRISRTPPGIVRPRAVVGGATQAGARSNAVRKKRVTDTRDVGA